jgi:hypothetical protein
LGTTARFSIVGDISFSARDPRASRRIPPNALSWPPQCQATINAAAWKAKLLGYVVEQTMVGKPKEFANVQGDSEERQREMLERLPGARWFRRC